MNDKQLRALAKRRGIRAAEEAALAAEAKRGVPPWAAIPTGLMAEDTRHLLLKGDRSYQGIVKGRTIMYDPLTDEAVIVSSRKDGVYVEIGAIMLREGLQADKAKLDLAAADHLIETYAEGQGEVGASRWLVEVVKKAALDHVQASGIFAPSYRGLMPHKPKVVWEELEALSIVQPWGAPVRKNPAHCLNPRKRWVRL
jgi:hypothetical protein